jgi:hypothetical protein
MTGAYLEFTELFAKLSPYELNHLSEVLLCKIEDCFESKLISSTKKELTERDLKFAFINAMRDTLLQMQEREIDQQKIKLRQKKREVFLIERIAA